MEVIKIVLVDDHSLFTEGLMQILDPIKDIQVIATFRDGETMLKSDEIHRADVLLLDINLPGNSGISIAEKMKPYFGSLKIICLSMLFEENILVTCQNLFILMNLSKRFEKLLLGKPFFMKKKQKR